jgi:aryl-alcohol dehydrogenase-like predicted oxidoreductase
MNHWRSKIIVGTAQFGNKYGVGNSSGATGEGEAHSMLRIASGVGIFRLDTAQAYGSSEKIIGSFPHAQFEVTSKVGRFPESNLDWGEWLASRIEVSRAELYRQKLTTVLFHDVSDFKNKNRSRAIRALSEASINYPELIFGASIYNPEDWKELREIQDLRMYQAPYSIFDRRFERTGTFEEMTRLKKKVSARSVFLQGLLLLPLGKLPKYFSPWEKVISEWRKFCRVSGLSPVAAAASFSLASPFLEGVVIGFDSRRHLDELVSGLVSLPVELVAYPDFGELPLELIDPRRWKLH